MANPRQHEIDNLFAAMKGTDDKRMYERYQAVYFYLQGYAVKDIPAMIGRSEKSIYNYVNAYEEKGIDGLVRGKSPGAPHKLTPEQEAELVQVIATNLPVDVGFPNKYNWTLQIIASFIEREWNQTFTIRGVSRLIKDSGLSYTRPTYTLENASPEKQKVFLEETFPEVRKTDK